MDFIQAIKEIPITNYAQRCGFTLVRKGQRYVSLKEHDSVMIDTYKNCFWRNSVFKRGMHGGAGSIIDFAIEFMRYDRKQAIRELAIMYDVSGDQEPKYNPIHKTDELPKRKAGDLELPPKADNTKAVSRYLLKERKIDISVIRYFQAKQMLYQDTRYNCVFVSHRFACIRSTGEKRFAIDVKGCDYDECFFFRPSNSCDTIIVAESVIDVMSIMTHFKRQGMRYTDYCYLALSGTNKLPSLFYHLRKDLGLKNILLALDNDEAGQTAQRAAEDELVKLGYNGHFAAFNSPSGKDWNDYIKATATE